MTGARVTFRVTQHDTSMSPSDLYTPVIYGIFQDGLMVGRIYNEHDDPAPPLWAIETLDGRVLGTRGTLALAQDMARMRFR